jgi:endonuclease/exonuclease/phosphatase family metal-dependent hydrolase
MLHIGPMEPLHRGEYSSWSYSGYQQNKQQPAASAPVFHNIPVNIITLNTFQLPWFVSTYNKLFGRISVIDNGESNCTDQEIRARLLIDRINGYDIVALQEMWGSNLDSVYAAMKEQYEMPEKLTKGISSGRMSEFYNHKAVMTEQTGGLFFGTKAPMIWYRHHRFEYDYGEEMLSKGVGFALLDMNEYWEGKYLLVCNVHMFSNNKNEDRIERQKQRDEINAEFVAMHTEELYPLGFNWDNCGVIMVGTLNTSYYRLDRSGRAMEYHKLMADFAPRAGATQDFFMQKHPDQPRAQTFDFIHNKYVISTLGDDAGRVDYILGIGSIPRGNGMRTNTMTLEATECDIIRPDRERPRRDECSDHFAVYAKLRPAAV